MSRSSAVCPDSSILNVPAMTLGISVCLAMFISGTVFLGGCAGVCDAQALPGAASMAHDGFARAMRPAHSMWDGDTIFVLATGEVEVDVNVVGILGARTMARAIANAVLYAAPAYGLPAARDLSKTV